MFYIIFLNAHTQKIIYLLVFINNHFIASADFVLFLFAILNKNNVYGGALESNIQVNFSL